MQNLFNQDRALSPATIRFWVNILSALFSIAALIIFIKGTITLFEGGTFLVGLLQISAGIGILLAFYLIVRLQAEALLASQRTHDRLTVLADALSPRTTPAPQDTDT